MVTSAMRPRPVSASASLNSVSGSEVLPDERRAHAHADAQGGEAVANLRPLPEAVRELREQAHAGRGERGPAGDRGAGRVEPLGLRVDAEAVAPAEHLNRDRLVELEEAELVEREPRAVERLPRRRDWPEAHSIPL